jgi:hypothetical protein
MGKTCKVGGGEGQSEVGVEDGVEARALEARQKERCSGDHGYNKKR